MIRIGTRKSNLAVAQAKIVKNILENLSYKVKLVRKSSLGDQDLVSPLSSFRGQSAFTRSIERLLLRKEVDLAVHSLKDLGLDGLEDLEILTVLQRHSPNDLLLIKADKVISTSPLLMKDQTRIGTGSVRRQAELRAMDQGIIPIDIRGNIETRISQLKEEHLDGIILAQAVFERMSPFVPGGILKIPLPIDYFPTSPGQGAIAIQVRKGEFRELMEIGDSNTLKSVSLERDLLAEFGEGCDNGVGITITRKEGVWHLYSFFMDLGYRYVHLIAESLEELRTTFLEALPNSLRSNAKTFPFNDKVGVIFTDRKTGLRYKQILASVTSRVFIVPVFRYEVHYTLLEDKKLKEHWEACDWVILTSKQAIPFLSALTAYHPRTAFKLAVVGGRTAELLRELGFPVHIVAARGANELNQLLLKKGGRKIYLSGERVSQKFEETMRFTVYKTINRKLQRIPEVDFAVVFSNKSAEHVLNSLGNSFSKNWIAIGRRTANYLRGRGIDAINCDSPTPQGVITALTKEEIQ